MKSEFLDWFKAQHGPRESGLLAGHSEQMLSDEVQRGKVAAAELDARRLWDEKHQSALYAWTARDQAPKAIANLRAALTAQKQAAPFRNLRLMTNGAELVYPASVTAEDRQHIESLGDLLVPVYAEAKPNV